MRINKWTAGLFLVVAATCVLGCGSGGSTTVIKKAAAPPEAQTVTETTTTQAPPNRASASKPKPAAPAPAPAPAPAAPSGSPPDVVGLALPEAKRELQAAGFKANVSNTDTLLGIVVPRNYTVCKERSAHGDVVPILAQKYGC